MEAAVAAIASSFAIVIAAFEALRENLGQIGIYLWRTQDKPLLRNSDLILVMH